MIKPLTKQINIKNTHSLSGRYPTHPNLLNLLSSPNLIRIKPAKDKSRKTSNPPISFPNHKLIKLRIQYSSNGTNKIKFNRLIKMFKIILINTKECNILSNESIECWIMVLGTYCVEFLYSFFVVYELFWCESLLV